MNLVNLAVSTLHNINPAEPQQSVAQCPWDKDIPIAVCPELVHSKIAGLAWDCEKSSLD